MFLSSLYFALLATCKPKIWQTTEMYSPQTFFSVTAAVVIYLHSLLTMLPLWVKLVRYPIPRFILITVIDHMTKLVNMVTIQDVFGFVFCCNEWLDWYWPCFQNTPPRLPFVHGSFVTLFVQTNYLPNTIERSPLGYVRLRSVALLNRTHSSIGLD